MAGIIKRTIYKDESDGYVRWIDWSRVITGIGQMMEPRTPYFYSSSDAMQSTRDATDMMTMVNAIENFPIGRDKYLSGCDEPVIGGDLYPRYGR